MVEGEYEISAQYLVDFRTHTVNKTALWLNLENWIFVTLQLFMTGVTISLGFLWKNTAFFSCFSFCFLLNKCAAFLCFLRGTVLTRMPQIQNSRIVEQYLCRLNYAVCAYSKFSIFGKHQFCCANMTFIPSCWYSSSGMLLNVHHAVHLCIRNKQVVMFCASAEIFAVYVQKVQWLILFLYKLEVTMCDTAQALKLNFSLRFRRLLHLSAI